MKLDDYGFKQYNIGETTARILRDSLLECEEGINSLGRSIFNYPEDQITGKQKYYNLVVHLEEWERYALPFIKEIVADFLSLTSGEVCKIKSLSLIHI